MVRTFGVEIEMVGLRREVLAGAVASIVGGSPRECLDPADPALTYWAVTASDGREWKVEDDDSLSGAPENRAELVTPVLTEKDLGLLEQVVAELTRMGATADQSCGVHVHIGAIDCEVEQLNRMIEIMMVFEPVVIDKMLGLSERRKGFAALMAPEFIQAFKDHRPKTVRELEILYRGDDDEKRRADRYDRSRYCGLNLHSLSIRGTVDFRYFNGTVEAKRVLEYVRLCIGIADEAGLSTGTDQEVEEKEQKP